MEKREEARPVAADGIRQTWARIRQNAKLHAPSRMLQLRSKKIFAQMTLLCTATNCNADLGRTVQIGGSRSLPVATSGNHVG
jgi:hypothetical protein